MPLLLLSLMSLMLITMPMRMLQRTTICSSALGEDILADKILQMVSIPIERVEEGTGIPKADLSIWSRDWNPATSMRMSKSASKLFITWRTLERKSVYGFSSMEIVQQLEV